MNISIYKVNADTVRNGTLLPLIDWLGGFNDLSPISWFLLTHLLVEADLCGGECGTESPKHQEEAGHDHQTEGVGQVILVWILDPLSVHHRHCAEN